MTTIAESKVLNDTARQHAIAARALLRMWVADVEAEGIKDDARMADLHVGAHQAMLQLREAFDAAVSVPSFYEGELLEALEVWSLAQRALWRAMAEDGPLIVEDILIAGRMSLAALDRSIGKP